MDVAQVEQWAVHNTNTHRMKLCMLCQRNVPQAELEVDPAGAVLSEVHGVHELEPDEDHVLAAQTVGDSSK